MGAQTLPYTSTWQQAEAIATSVLKKWQGVGCDVSQFPEISAQVLRDEVAPDTICVRSILSDLMDADESIADYQRQSNFSDLPLNLYADEDIIVQALFWQTATTSIHNHTFCGAFKLLQGASLQCEYSISDWYPLHESVAHCQMRVKKSDFLQVGDVHVIKPGMETVHSVYHIENPSVTLLVALNARHIKQTQSEFRGFNFAVAQHLVCNLLIRKIQALQLMRSQSESAYNAQLLFLYQNSPLGELFWIHRHVFPSVLVRSATLAKKLESCLSEREIGKDMMISMVREKLVIQLMNFRAKVDCSDVRLALALLANVPDMEHWQKILLQVFKGQKGCQAFISTISKKFRSELHFLDVNTLNDLSSLFELFASTLSSPTFTYPTIPDGNMFLPLLNAIRQR